MVLITYTKNDLSALRYSFTGIVITVIEMHDGTDLI